MGFTQKTLDDNSAPQLIESSPIDLDLSSSLGESEANEGNTTLILSRSKDSHFYVDGAINGVPVHFLVDTGASIVTIPTSIAESAGLVAQTENNMKTASGLAKGFQTTIQELEISSYKFNNVTAEIVTGEQALLGMNILDQFDMIQDGDELTLKPK